MKSFAPTVAAAVLATLTFVASPTLAGEPISAAAPADLSLALAIEGTKAPQCRAGVDESGQCGTVGVEVAAGAECPATSGSYCSDELPYCCGTPGNYYCAKDVNGC